MKQNKLNMSLLFMAGVTVLLFAPFIGPKFISIGILSKDPSLKFIFTQLRIPRTILSFIAGGSLSLSGLIFQNLFKNKLATPYTLGISSGAAAGALIAIKLNLFGSIFGFGFSYIAGFSGGLLSVLIIMAILRITGSSSVYTILLSGVAISFFFSAFILLIQYLVDMTQSISAIRWLMGNLSVSGYKEILILTPFFIIYIVIILLLQKELILISGGDEFAVSRGMNVKKFRISIFILVSLITGMIVSVTGPIGFVGLIIPHIMRIFINNNYKLLIISSTFFGGVFLVLADIISRTIISPAEIPVGIITSFFGAPFFIIILVSGIKSNK